MNSVAVFCGSSEGNDQEIIEQSYLLGKTLAKRKMTLVYGGAKIGIMGQVARGVLEHNGQVLGVIPDFL
ncbi:MAG: TIGR00730 family Rossman fold protein, partial [Mangrovimonas sp.]|nr:TIGR00730 family Rossman fold protein [Mangrovimonas sp.]